MEKSNTLECWGSVLEAIYHVKISPPIKESQEANSSTQNAKIAPNIQAQRTSELQVKAQPCH